MALNALLDDGEHSIDDTTAKHLRPDVGTAVVTEGLLNYFPRHQVLGMWVRFARFLKRFPRGMYTSDIHLDDAMHRSATSRALRRLLTVVAQGKVELLDGAKGVAELLKTEPQTLARGEVLGIELQGLAVARCRLFETSRTESLGRGHQIKLGTLPQSGHRTEEGVLEEHRGIAIPHAVKPLVEQG